MVVKVTGRTARDGAGEALKLIVHANRFR